MTGFEEILAQVPLLSNAKVLDVGAGGFAGETTTKHLVDRFDFVVAVERDRERAEQLKEKYKPHQLGVLVTDIENFIPLHKYDLVVIDLDEGQITWVIETLIMRYGRRIVTSGGYIISIWDDHLIQTRLARPILAGFKPITYVDKWEDCHIGWQLLRRD